MDFQYNAESFIEQQSDVTNSLISFTMSIWKSRPPGIPEQEFPGIS